MEPITFKPIYMERVWGGRGLETSYRRQLPDTTSCFGEAWEIVDREEAQSIVDQGPLAGKPLHALWNTMREEIFGSYSSLPARFPLLIKILDTCSDLSVQVHPPVELAEQLGGEPKTEMWFIANCIPGAQLHVGLKHGVTRKAFEEAIENGQVANCVHSIDARVHESIFIPSGRLHAIGGGFLIHEIQQNSDTTYRVFDWNRPGTDGKPRALHIKESLASIDFNDYEPSMTTSQDAMLADCPYFKTVRVTLKSGELVNNPETDRFSLLSVIEGGLISDNGRHFHQGQSLLLPRGSKPLTAETDTMLLQITLPGS
jgi:mannose-6-phosphate isomerase